MRLGLVIYGDLGQPSGGYAYDRRMVQYFRSRGAQVDILSLPHAPYRQALDHHRNPEVRELLLGWKGDVMIQDELCHPSLYQLNGELGKSNEPSAGRSFPLVGLVHHPRSKERHPFFLKRFLYAPVERSYLRGLDGFLFNSHTTRSDVESLVGRPLQGFRKGPVATPAPISHAEPGVPLGAPDDAPRLEPGPLKILFAAHLIPRKNLDTLIRALARLSPFSWTLTVAGSPTDPEYESLCRRWVSRLGLQDRVQFKGCLEQKDLTEAYRTHHLLAVPSDYEGFGMVYLDAMIQGCIPLGGTEGGAREVVGNLGYLSQPRHVGDLARTLAQVQRDLSQTEGWRLKVLACQDRASRFPSWEDGFKGFWDYLEALCGGGKEEEDPWKS